ncbi:MAG: uroporphyrinogen decarboxylase family protein [Clostridia bacterium]|jgi:hypothetical protein|nr:hypothetical protein [Clostridiaceae bacterium]
MGYVNEMTHKERILAAMGKQETDYSPCLIFFNPLHKVTRENRKFNFPWGEHATTHDVVKYCLETWNIPQLVHFHIPSRRMHKDVTVKTWKEGSLLYKQYDTPAGPLRAVVECNAYWTHGDDIPLGTDWTANFKKAWIEDEKDLECMKYLFIPWEPSPDEFKSLKENFTRIKNFADQYRLPVSTPGGMGLTLGLQLFLPEKLCLKVIENPAIVHEFLEMEHQCNRKVIELAGNFGVDIIQRNGFYETCDFYSPKMLEEFLEKRISDEVALTHQAGMKMMYTAHTGIMPMLDYLNRLNIDCIFGIDIAFPGVDLNKIKVKLFDKKSLFIGPSSTHHLWNPDPQVTRNAVRTVYETFGKRGIILGPCVSMHSIMPWENLLAMIDEWKIINGLS